MEQNNETPIKDTMEARQEGHAPAEGPPEHVNTPLTVPEPVATEVSSLGDTPPPVLATQPPSPPPSPTTQPPSPTPHPEHPAHTPDPENILDILEEE